MIPAAIDIRRARIARERRGRAGGKAARKIKDRLGGPWCGGSIEARRDEKNRNEAKCLWTSQIHRIHPNTPAATMMGIGLIWDFQKRIVHAAVIT